MDRLGTPSRPIASLMACLIAFTLVGLTAACDSGTQEPAAPKAAEPTRTPAAASPNAAARPETPRDGSIAKERFPRSLPSGVQAEVPDNMPDSIPIYPGAQPAQGRGGARDGMQMAGVQLLSNDPIEDVFAFYEGELKANGWDIVEAESNEGIAQINATNGSARAGVFITMSPLGGTDIFVLSEN